MNLKEIIVYGWITKQSPFIVVIGCDKKKIRACKEQAENHAGREVVFFRYNGICIDYFDKSFLGDAQKHNRQIVEFVKLMLKVREFFPDCIFNDARVKII